jgi:hypothetical protein
MKFTTHLMHTLQSLKHNCHYIYLSTEKALRPATEYSYEFHMSFTVNRDFFPCTLLSICLFNGMLCVFVWQDLNF